MQRKYLAAVLTAAFVLTACSDVVDGHPQGAGQGGGTGTFPTDAKSLGAFLLGNRAIKSAHLTLNETAAGTTVVSSGVEKLSGLKVEAMDMTETVNSTTLRFIVLGTEVYAQLPPALYRSTKPWVEINAATANIQLQQLYSGFQTARTSGVGMSADVFATAAKNIRLIRTETLDGVTVGHYSVTVEVAKLPIDFPNRAQVQQSGLSEIPVELFADAQGRTREVAEHFAISGQQVDLKYHLTKIDEPVSITAPPASEVEHG